MRMQEVLGDSDSERCSFFGIGCRAELVEKDQSDPAPAILRCGSD